MGGEIKELTTLLHESSVEMTEKKSVFIGHAKPIKSEEEALEFIKLKKHEYADATHNVYAYFLKNGVAARYSDDGEPGGTAGVPVLDVIKKSGVTDAVIVVTRYFGGVLLGAGGLVRAYSASAKLALDAAEIVTYREHTEFAIRCNYSDYQKLQPTLSRFRPKIDSTEFLGDVVVLGAVPCEDAEALSKDVSEKTSARAIFEIRGKRLDF